MADDMLVASEVRLQSRPGEGEQAATPEGLSSDLSWIDGFITAIAIGPEAIPPDEWLQVICGQFDANIVSPRMMDRLEARLIGAHDSLLGQLRQKPPTYKPWLPDDGHRRLVCAREWANGFYQGCSLRWTQWKTLLNDTAGRGHMTPIVALLSNADGSDKLVNLAEFAENRNVSRAKLIESLINGLPEAVGGIHAYWRKRDRRIRRSASEFYTGKVGRNDTCPCGSGKKYKTCCLN